MSWSQEKKHFKMANIQKSKIKAQKVRLKRPKTFYELLLKIMI